MRRRAVIVGLGAVAITSHAAPAQQSGIKVVGLLSSRAPDDVPQLLAAFRQGLKDNELVEGQSVSIESRFAAYRFDRLPALAAELVQRRVSVIAALGAGPALAAKGATTTIPIVFETGADPRQLGLVASFSRPGGNLTGISQLNLEVVAKTLQLMHELVPTARAMALLVDPHDRPNAETNVREVAAAAHTLGLELHVLNASSDAELEAGFATVTQLRAGGLVIGADQFFTARIEQLGALAARYAVPTVYKGREFAAAGGVLGYGPDTADVYRLAGAYTGRVLKGDKPADLPVQQTTKIELFVNLKAAKALGLAIPQSILLRADEVIE